MEVFSQRGYFDAKKQMWCNVNLHELDIRSEGKTMFRRKFNSLIAMLKTKKVVNKSDAYKLILTFDTISFAIGSIYLNKEKFFLLHHKNIDELTNPIKRILFKTYMNRVSHIVFEDQFKEYLIKSVGVNEKNVFVVPHPVFGDKEIHTMRRYDCIGLSNSNDEDFIGNIIKTEKEIGFFKENNLHVILRSKTYLFDNGNLKVISGQLSRDIYDSYIQQTQVVFVPLPSTFTNRLSGAFYDAFSNYKFVISKETPIINEYMMKYPNTCIGINGVDDFLNTLKILINQKIAYDAFDSFIKDHSDNVIRDKFLETFKMVQINESN